MLVDGHLFNAEGTVVAEEDNDGIVMKGPGWDDNHKLARLAEVVELGEATPLAEDSHKIKVATAASCIEDVEAEAGVDTVVVVRMKKDNVTEEAAGSIDWRVC